MTLSPAPFGAGPFFYFPPLTQVFVFAKIPPVNDNTREKQR